MKKILFSIFLLVQFHAFSQPGVMPALPQQGAIALTHATIHVGNGQVIEDGTLVFEKGKITSVGKAAPPAGASVTDCRGKEIYPGIILADSYLGLVEIGAVRAGRDAHEIGVLNPGVRSVVAYNTDSKIINTLRSNGILLANIVPEGGIISGSSSVMKLDGWNWEDAVYSIDNGIHFRMPNLAPENAKEPAAERLKKAYAQIDEVRTFLREAKAYLHESSPVPTNIKFHSVKGLFDGSKIFFVHCNLVNEMMIAVELAKEFGFRTVIVGGTDSDKIAGYLKENNIAVVLNQMHTLPVMQDDDVDMYAKLPYRLQQAGVLYCINDFDEMNRGRNLAFNAGVAVGYGLSKEEALQAITLNPAKILGIDGITGSLEVGKDANIIVSEGDVLDITTSKITHAFIEGSELDLNNVQKQLYERYRKKYGLTK